MPPPKRPQRQSTDESEQLRLFVASREQETYELIRPIVLFGQTPADRARTTGVAESTLRRKAHQFDAHGMASLFDTPQRSAVDRRALPSDIRQAIVDLKAEYPPFRPHEIAEICHRRFDRPISHHTVQRVLAEGRAPSRTTRRYLPYDQIADPAERRLAIVRLFFEGWNIKSISGYLETTRRRVYQTMQRWIEEGVRSLDEKSHAPRAPSRKTDLKALAAVRRLQANPELGEFRIHAALAQLGIHLSPRTCGRILAQHRALYDLPGPSAQEPREKRPMPFAASRRHEYWSVDVRYVEDHQLEIKKPVYVISVLDNYSRALLASAISPRQDLTAYLIVLRAAIQQHGCPEALVSDSGSIFKAKHAMAIYAALGIEKFQIERAQPWQNYIETHFNVMRRMADYHYAQATTWSQIRAAHDRFFADYNYQSHYAHRERSDGKRSPAAVLGWVQGAWWKRQVSDRTGATGGVGLGESSGRDG